MSGGGDGGKGVFQVRDTEKAPLLSVSESARTGVRPDRPSSSFVAQRDIRGVTRGDAATIQNPHLGCNASAQR